MSSKSLTGLQKLLVAVIVFILIGYVGFFVVKSQQKSTNDASVSSQEYLPCNAENFGRKECRPGASGNPEVVCTAGFNLQVFGECSNPQFSDTDGGMCNEPSDVGKTYCVQGGLNYRCTVGSYYYTGTGNSCGTPVTSCPPSDRAHSTSFTSGYDTKCSAYSGSSMVEYYVCASGQSISNGACVGGSGGGGQGAGSGDNADNPGNPGNPGGPGTGAPVVLSYPKLGNNECTYLKQYNHPEINGGKPGIVKCAPKANGEPRVCEETKTPKATSNGGEKGNGICVEKKTAAGEQCKYNVQCAKEKLIAPGLPAAYVATELDMRCEKRDTADGKVESDGIGMCLPRFKQPASATENIGCGLNGDTDAVRDQFCRDKFAIYTQITEGTSGTEEKDKFRKLDYPNHAYCHKRRNAAGEEKLNRYECRLQRGEGRRCNPLAGNQCMEGLVCAKEQGKNKYSCQAVSVGN